MKIGFIGYGVLSSELMGRCASSGHTVLINNPSGNSIIQEAIQKIGSGIKMVSLQEAAAAEIIVLFAPKENLHDLIKNLPDMAEKIIIHTGNLIFDPSVPDQKKETESFKILASLLPLARCIQLFIPYWLESNSQKKDELFYHSRCAITRKQTRTLLGSLEYSASEISQRKSGQVFFLKKSKVPAQNYQNKENIA